jgi:hypothetical protein
MTHIYQFRIGMSHVDFENPDQMYAYALELLRAKKYQHSAALFKLCIENMSQSSIQLLPRCLNSLAVCYEAMADVNRACVFKKFEKMYYEQVLVKKSLDMIDEEKENYQEILNRVKQLEKLARLCDRNECTDLTIDYITKAVSIKEKDDSSTKVDRQTDREMSQTVRKRGSILKTSSSSTGSKITGSNSFDLTENAENSSKKKKVHWPQHLPRYTIEKRWRNIRKVLH